MSCTDPPDMPTHPPAVVRGLPKAALRFYFRAVVPPLPFILAWIVVAWFVIGILPVTVLLTVGIVLMGLLPALAFAFVVRSAFRFDRVIRQLAANPLACLNCAYPTTDPATGICPECAHRSDRAALTPRWRRNLECRAPKPGPDPDP